MSVTDPSNVFVSYSLNDESFLSELLEHLKPFERLGSVSKWSDKDITPGSNKLGELKTALATTKVAVLLVSPSFLASDFIHQYELGPLLKEAETGGVQILWIPVRACSWKATPLRKYKAALSPDTPLAEMKTERDKAWVKICESIGESLAATGRSSLRKLVCSVLITSSDFDAFCINYFRHVYDHFVDEIDREGKLNLLLALADAAQLRSSLREAHPERVAFFERHQGRLLPKEQQRLDAASRLKELLRKRAVLVEYGFDSAKLDGELDRERRALRQGPRVKPGEVLSERYQLIQKLNQGAYGEIWLARDIRSDTDVAIKILHAKWNDREEIVSRFAEVAEQVASLSHPHVISVMSSVVEWEEFHYYVMEYLAGGDLHQAVLRDRDHLKTRFFLERIAHVGSALACLHGKGLVHRDVKPQNILLDAKGAAKISDFDLLGGDILKRSTETGETRGTFLYAAPEQFGNAAHADTRADIHALGRTALFVIYGKDLDPRAGDDRVRFIEKMSIASELKLVLLQATEPDPVKRYPTISEFCAALTESLRNPSALSKDLEPVTATVTSDDEVHAIVPNPPLVEQPVPQLENAQGSEPLHPKHLSKQVNSRVFPLKSICYVFFIVFTVFFPAYIAKSSVTRLAYMSDKEDTVVDLAKPDAPLPLTTVSVPTLDLATESPKIQTQDAPKNPVSNDTIDKAAEEVKPKDQALKRSPPKTDQSVLQQAISKIKTCIVHFEDVDTIKATVNINISSEDNSFVLTSDSVGTNLKEQCVYDILKKVNFPSNKSERSFVAKYLFSHRDGDSVTINYQN